MVDRENKSIGGKEGTIFAMAEFEVKKDEQD